MKKKLNIVCVIPARLNSTRLPEKILAPLNGKPLLEHVWNAASKTSLFSKVVLAIDSPKTEKVVRSFEGEYIMTSEQHTSGTSRLIEVMESKKVEGDIWVNWQGDEPFINEQMIHDLLKNCHEGTHAIWTLKKQIIDKEQIANPNIVKVVTDVNGSALYFSRSPIPFYRELTTSARYYQHIGLYAYTSQALHTISQLPPAYLEEAEMLEQLRFLYHTIKIQVNETLHDAHGINTYDDLLHAQTLFNHVSQPFN